MDQIDILTTPIGFIEGVLGLSLYGWQDEVVTKFEDTTKRTKASVVAPNGSGKDDRIIAGISLWWTSVHKRGKVVITSKDSRQLDEQTYPAISKHASKFKDWKFIERYIETPTGGKIILFTTDEPGRAEGWHKGSDLDEPLLIIVNEAKSVEERIFQAFDKCTFNALLYISSAGLAIGRFYDSQTKDAERFYRRVVKLSECPHISQERIDDIIASYGPEHPFTKATLHSEFSNEGDESNFVFPLSVLNRTLSSPPTHQRGDKYAFCDFAAGRDENVLAIRSGNKVEIAAAWRDSNTMSAVGRFIIEFKKNQLRVENIFGDEGGLGKPMCDALREAGWDINRVNSGVSAFDDRYMSRGAESWFAVKEMCERGELILPDDPKLHSQLTTRKVRTDSRGRLGIETKEDMRKRGLPSPDRADAVIGSICSRPLVSHSFTEKRQSWLDQLNEHSEQESYALAGMDAGL